MSITVLGLKIMNTYLEIPLHQIHGPVFNRLFELSPLLLLFLRY